MFRRGASCLTDEGELEMGKKFDARLPSMTDDELAGVDEQILNEKSCQKLSAERRKRESRAAKQHRDEGSWWNKTNAAFAVLTIVIALLALLLS